MPNLPNSIWPACFPDSNGQVYLRGHVTLMTEPAIGSGLLAIFPKNSSGSCACTPIPDPGTYDNNVIVTTTALAYPTPTPNLLDVCIVRLLISLYVPIDVNQDLVVNETDSGLVLASPYYDNVVRNTSKCPQASDGTRVCGRVDVNNDGFVNDVDLAAMAQSVDYKNGTMLPCGGVFATAFSCGTSRSAPLTPAVDISLDSIVYFNNDGETGVVSLSRKRAVLGRKLVENILVDFEHLHSDVLDFRSDVTRQLAAVNSKVASVGSKTMAVRTAADAVGSKVAAVDTELDSKVSTIRSTVRQVKYKFGVKFDQHAQALRRSQPVSQREMLVGASVASGVVVISGVLAYFLAKRR